MNRSQIFRNAHAIRKTNNVSLSVALKISWAAAKADDQATVNPWAKGSHSRVYVKSWDGTQVYVDLNDMTVKHRNKGYERSFASKVFGASNFVSL